MPHCLDQGESSSVGVKILFDLLDHLIDKLSEEGSVKTRKQGTCHLESLFTVVISIVLSGSTQCTREKSVYHVTNKEGFLKVSIRIG